MRILFAALLAAVVALTSVAPVSAAVSAKEEQELLLKKKKKKLAQQRIIDARQKSDALSKLKAKKQADKRKLEAAKPQRVARKRDCGSFMQCLFGKRKGVRVDRRSGVQLASFAGAGGISSRSRKSTVRWTESKYGAGTIIVKTAERALYYVNGNGTATRYAIGVGKEGFQWSGTNRVSRKSEWPSWTPPQQMIEREAAKGHFIPDFMEGGPGNPLGARAIYIGSSIYRIHGTNNEASIGGAVSSGCIRMMNADVIDLYNKVKVGARIHVF